VIALVDTRTARLDEGVIGVVISTHERMTTALAANLEFQRSQGTRGHVTTKILALSRRLLEGETVLSEDVWQNPLKLTPAVLARAMLLPATAAPQHRHDARRLQPKQGLKRKLAPSQWASPERIGGEHWRN
jgi:hypothetical protein